MSFAVSIFGRRYRVHFPRLRLASRDGSRTVGRCDPPEQPNKAIELDSRLRGRELLEVAIHEALHAADFHKLDESWVERVAHDIAVMLWRRELRERIWDASRRP